MVFISTICEKNCLNLFHFIVKLKNFYRNEQGKTTWKQKKKKKCGVLICVRIGLTQLSEALSKSTEMQTLICHILNNIRLVVSCTNTTVQKN